jgi:hypothetical protein
MSTVRLFQLGLSFGVCKRKGHWPSLETMNSFLKQGTDDGELATTIEWDPCELTQQEYEGALGTFMEGLPFQVDTRRSPWEDWFAELSSEHPA